MAHFSLCFPVVSGKATADIESISRMFRTHPDEYRESRIRGGVTLERAYLQETPMGSFVVAYIESDRSISLTLATLVSSDLQIDRDFVRMVKDVHGVDLGVPAPGPEPEVLGEWIDSEVKTRKAGLAFTAPLAPGMTDQGRAFVQAAFRDRAAEMAESRRALGASREIVTLQPNPAGDVVNVYIEGDDPAAANARFAASARDFDVWFKGELAKIFPPAVDFSQPVGGVSELFDSQAVGLGEVVDLRSQEAAHRA